MKKALLALVVIGAALCGAMMLAGCSSASPGDVVSQNLKLFSSGKMDKILAILPSSLGEGSEKFDVSELLSEEKSTGTSDAWKEFNDVLRAKITDFDFTIKSETITGSNAEVTVEFTTYNTAAALVSGLTTGATKNLLLVFSGASEDEMSDTMAQYMTNELNALTEKTLTSETTFALTKGKDGWQMDTLTAANLDVMFGGLGSMLSSSVSDVAAMLQ